MRRFAALAVLMATPALAEAPRCAIQGPIEMAQAETPAVQASPVPAAATPTATQPTRPGQYPIPPGLAAMPFVQHVAAAGATVFDLGASHGLHLVTARSGDEFRIFAILPNGQAAVEGAPVELAVPQLTAIASGNMTALGEKAGFTGYFVRSGPMFQVFYAAPDNMVVVPGILRDAAGKNLTRDQVAKIPGAVPTVEILGGDVSSVTPAALRAAASGDGTSTALALVEKADYGTIGPASAPQLFMLIDPQCIYSVRSYQTLRGYAQAGKIRLSVVPLSVLDYEDRGQSTRSALALLSKPSDQIVTAWQSGDVAGPVALDAATRLRQNMAIAEAIGIKGTPTFIWRKTDGTDGRIDGVPMDVGALVSSIGR
jgi:thiol:disulfide interchange protein DsbG